MEESPVSHRRKKMRFLADQLVEKGEEDDDKETVEENSAAYTLLLDASNESLNTAIADTILQQKDTPKALRTIKRAFIFGKKRG